ncbi:Hypothetical predicted protein [Mytilus galloprovincialis]|uniref:B box-type domain-containing protein n=1 Tax=Mytilus galloprovincialis TaxID=29158 RepID=A0A8B6EDY3_MYTGA|nr:Hypothetical predicted protein [Mytilus galloprovincialis]
MATSSKSTSIRKAQVPVSCYFCKGQEIKWKCEDCNVRMCNSCKITVHQGLQSVQEHDVVSIQDISQFSSSSQTVTSVVISSVFNSYTTTLPAVHKRKISDIATNKDGEILFIEHRDHKIQVLSHTGEVKTVLDSSPMKLFAIHVNKDNEVVVGLREPGPPFPVHNFSVRQIITFSGDYNRRETIEFDKKGNKLFNYAFCIRTDSRNIVYIIDIFDNDSNGRIVAVDRNGRLKFIYDGQKDTETFQPNGITITPSDNIVVSDYYNKALHVINSKGDLLGLQFIFKDLGINDPYSLCFDSEGYLLIGCGKRNNEDCGKIHVVKMVDSLV